MFSGNIFALNSYKLQIFRVIIQTIEFSWKSVTHALVF